jgi:prepilin-type N-terminal cleavage/methylation domain-containing protein
MKTQRNKNGMTLIEIMFAFAIIATVLTLSYAASLNAWRTATSSNQRTQAQYLVQQSLEAVKAYRETEDFFWDDFMDELAGASSGFYMVMLNKDGSEIPNSYVCPAGAEPCEFKLNSGEDNDLKSIGSNTSVPDNTTFILKIRPAEYYEANSNSANGGAPPAGSDNITAVNLIAEITWTDTNGIVSNLAASTIITEPR